jgi:hypothetical protein
MGRHVYPIKWRICRVGNSLLDWHPIVTVQKGAILQGLVVKHAPKTIVEVRAGLLVLNVISTQNEPNLHVVLTCRRLPSTHAFAIATGEDLQRAHLGGACTLCLPAILDCTYAVSFARRYWHPKAE